MVRVNASTGAIELYDDAGALRWSGRPLGFGASVVLSIPGTNDVIVLCNADERRERGPFRNLLRVAPDGSVVWRADLPGETGDDAYVAVRWVGGKLVANTWSAHRV